MIFIMFLHTKTEFKKHDYLKYKNNKGYTYLHWDKR